MVMSDGNLIHDDDDNAWDFRDSSLSKVCQYYLKQPKTDSHRPKRLMSH